jgi:hypothetical protein
LDLYILKDKSETPIKTIINVYHLRFIVNRYPILKSKKDSSSNSSDYEEHTLQIEEIK